MKATGVVYSAVKSTNCSFILFDARSTAVCGLLCRRGHDDLGDHYLDCGDLANALKCYSRARDYCTTARHLVNMCLNVIKVQLQILCKSLRSVDLQCFDAVGWPTGGASGL